MHTASACTQIGQGQQSADLYPLPGHVAAVKENVPARTKTMALTAKEFVDRENSAAKQKADEDKRQAQLHRLHEILRELCDGLFVAGQEQLSPYLRMHYPRHKTFWSLGRDKSSM